MPSPFASSDTNPPRDQNIRTIGNQQQQQQFHHLQRPPPGPGYGNHRSHSPSRDGPYHHRPDQPRRPLGSGLPLPLPLPGGHFKPNQREPPPPGFDDGPQSNQGDKGREDGRGRNRYEDENRPPQQQQQQQQQQGPMMGMMGPGPMPPMGMPFPPNMNMMPPGFMPPPLIGPPGMFRKFTKNKDTRFSLAQHDLGHFEALMMMILLLRLVPILYLQLGQWDQCHPLCIHSLGKI